jgi:hypothetical protein
MRLCSAQVPRDFSEIGVQRGEAPRTPQRYMGVQ